MKYRKKEIGNPFIFFVETASAFWSCSVISHPRWGIKSLAEPTDTVTMIVMIIMVVMIITQAIVYDFKKSILFHINTLNYHCTCQNDYD